MRRKSKAMMGEIQEMLTQRFVDARGRTQCGIIYCLSRAECERVAAELQGLTQKNGRRLTAGCARGRRRRWGWWRWWWRSWWW